MGETTGRVRPTEGGYIRRLDPDYITMVADVRDVKQRIGEIETSSHRTERYLVGGWDESGTIWVAGVREDLRDVKRIIRWFWAMAAGVWAIFLVLLGRIAVDYIPAMHMGAPH